MKRHLRIPTGMALALGVLLGSTVTGTLAGANPGSPIGSGQTFVGLVNGKQPTATVMVLCAGPSVTGHPLGHQTVAVSRAPAAATGAGFTGSRARSVVAGFGGPATNPSVTLRSYGTRPIPTSLVLPCAGEGKVVFSPRPTSKTARSTSVTVTYLNLGAAARAAGSSRTVIVTQADSGRSLTLHKGDRLGVKLSGPAAFTWTEPVSSDPAVLRRRTGSSGADASATFLAVSLGKVTVTATDNPNCYPRCLIASRAFEVGVSITD
jgi:hypothetical protein